MPVPLLYVTHAVDDIHNAPGTRNGVAQLDQEIVIIKDDLLQPVPDHRGLIFTCIEVPDITFDPLCIEGVRQADPGDIRITEGQHIRIAVGHMAQVAFSEPAPDIMQQAKDICFFRIHSGIRRDFRRTVRGSPAVVSPGPRIALLRFSEEQFRLQPARISPAAVLHGQPLLVLNDVRVPVNQLLQVRAGEFRTQAAELNVVTAAARVNRAPAGSGPFGYYPVRRNTSRACALPPLFTSGAVFPARGDHIIINPVHVSSFSSEIRIRGL